MTFEEIIQQLKDVLAATPAMPPRQEARLEEHEKSLEARERAHREWLLEHQAAMRELDRKLDLIQDRLPKDPSSDAQH